MLSDPRTFSALVAGLINDAPSQTSEPISPSAPTPKHEGRLNSDQLSRLLSLGLNDRDLDYMGPRQRQMVLDILRTEPRKSAAA